MNGPAKSVWMPLGWFLLLYSVTLLLLLDHLPLWLDEIATMNVLVQPNLGALISSLKSMTGGTPLPFIASSWFVTLLGKTAFAARLWSAIASIASCAGVFVLARRAGLRYPVLATVLFAVCPLQFRYAMEARPYAMALAFSVWSTVAFLWLVQHLKERGQTALSPPVTDSSSVEAGRRQGGLSPFLYYCVTVILACNTMVNAMFIAAAHGLWLVATREGRRIPRSVLYVTIAAMLIAAASLVPWYLLFRDAWTINSQSQHVTPVSWNALGVVAHELTGAGYVGTALVLIGIGLSFARRTRESSDQMWFHVIGLLLPALLVPVADLVFYYFFAMRQMLFILPSLFVLVGLGVEQGISCSFRRCLWIATLITFLIADYNWLTRPHEDWSAAGAAATAHLADPAACVEIIPEPEGSPFLFAHPGLQNRLCPSNPTGAVILAISHYESDERYAAARDKLLGSGYTRRSEEPFAGPRVEVYGH